MSNYNSLKTTIDANIKQNGRQEITGQILNSVLNQMVNTLGAGYQFAGVATTATNPGSPDAKVFYIANGKGTYTNFGGIEVTEDEVVVLYWDSSWHKVSTGIASQASLSELVGFRSSYSITTSGQIGRVQEYDYVAYSGDKFTIESNVVLNIRFLKGENIVRVYNSLQPNDPKTFTIPGDIDKIRIWFNAIGNIVIVKQGEIDDIKDNMSSFNSTIDTLSSRLDAFDNKVDSYSITTSGQIGVKQQYDYVAGAGDAIVVNSTSVLNVRFCLGDTIVRVVNGLQPNYPSLLNIPSSVDNIQIWFNSIGSLVVTKIGKVGLIGNFLDRTQHQATYALKKAQVPIICIVDDDTINNAQVNTFYNKCVDAGVVGTYACLTSYPMADSTLLSNLKDKERKGFQVTLHSHTQTNAFRPEVQYRDLANAREDLTLGCQEMQEMGFLNPNYWVTPFGVDDSDMQKMARSLGLECLVNTSTRLYNTIVNTNRYKINRIALNAVDATGGVTFDELKEYARLCILDGGWLLVNTHMYGDSDWVDSTRLTEFVTYCKSVNASVQFLTLADAWKIKGAIYKLYEMF